MKNPTFSHPISCMGNQAGFPSPLSCFFDKVLVKSSVVDSDIWVGLGRLGRVYKCHLHYITILSCNYLIETNKRDKGYIFLLGVQFYQIYGVFCQKNIK